MSRAARFGREQLRAANAKLIEQVTELERAEEVRNLLAAIVESSDDAIIAQTLEGTIVSWNRGAENLYGYTAEEAVGKPIAMLIPPERRDELPATMEQIKRGEVAHRLETVRVRKGGGTIDVALTISPIYAENGRLTGTATIARDVSVRKQAERELVHAHRTAVETAHAKSEFVANMSHEFRTPLNGVIGMTGLLADTPLDQRQHEYLDALAASNVALLAVIDEVLDFSKLEAGHVELEPSTFDCRAAVEEALLMLAVPARAKGFEISQRVEHDVPATVRGDRVRLRQILLSLLSNAVKFTASGQVLLHVSVADGDRLRFTVSDTGVGIDDDDSASLFEAFAQADPSSTRRYGGMGLGLAISHQLVTLMGGQIGAEDRDGAGARFWFTAKLPVAPSGRTRPAAAPDSRVVLLAEDDEINRHVTAALMHKRGLGIAIAHHGREAVHMAGACRYDAILMDCQMPEIDGYEATRRIREAEQPRHTPIIALTAHAMPGDRERCLGAGMDDYIAKPVRTEELDSVLARWLPGEPSAQPDDVATGPSGGGATRAADPDGRDTETQGAGEGGLDLIMIAELKDMLTAEMREELLGTFEQSLPGRVADIARAARNGDRSELQRMTHLLKGSSASIGAASLSVVAGELERLSGEPDTTVGQEQLDVLDATATAICPALRRQLL